ncbi:Dps family protein [Conservatibacter flavescens]|uniref:Ferritin/DPS domain-containing protein n=1 Tax=Conservatibacter flavescens TaxID=28161 RepID=A0A2M8S1H5_9PAST|nr:DNA starvation/stationary phase protection protein [Conservatibacter flavescens]PJG85011.1 hypothetical protein CVP05_08255 [Conservatibacter flavescens]
MSKIQVLKTLHATLKSFTFEMQKYHWMIKGKGFYELHKAFEGLYNWGFEQEDEIAERLLIIGDKPLLNLTEVMQLNQINVLPENELTEANMINNLKNSFDVFLNLARQGLELCENDVGTDSLLSDFIADVEKQAWMLKAYLA